MIAKVVEKNDNGTLIELICEKGPDGEEIGHCGACGQATSDNKKKIVYAKNEVNAAVGNMVECELEAAAKTKAALILFLLPLIIFLVTTGVVTSMGIAQGLIFLISFLSLVITFAGLRLILLNKTFYKITKVKEN